MKGFLLKNIYPIAAIILVLVVLIGGIIYVASQDSSDGFSAKKEKEFMDSYIEMVVKPEEPKKIYESLVGNIDKVQASERSNMIDGFVYAIYQYADKETLVLEEKYLEEVMKLHEAGVTFETLEGFQGKASKDLEDFLVELEAQKTYVSKVNNHFSVQPKLPPIITEFYDYMDEELRMLLEFNHKETYLSFMDAEESLLLDELILRTVELEKMKNSTNDDYYKDTFKMLYEFYLEMYLGTIHDYHFIEGTKTYKPEVVEHFKNMQSGFPEAEVVTEFLPILLASLEENNNQLSDNAYGEMVEKFGNVGYVDLGDGEEQELTQEEIEALVEEAVQEKKE